MPTIKMQIAKAIPSTLKWKGTGLDHITNFLLKILLYFYEKQVATFGYVLKNPEGLEVIVQMKYTNI